MVCVFSYISLRTLFGSKESARQPLKTALGVFSVVQLFRFSLDWMKC